MKKILLSFLTLGLISVGTAQTKFTKQIVKTGVDQGVDVSSDDAEQENNAMDKLYDDDLDAGWEGDDFNTLTMGMRFTDVTIPQGSQIDSAYVEVYAHEDETDLAKITIWAEATDDAATFDLNNLITSRTKTTAQVTWNCSEQWTMWQKYRSEDFASVVQEIVNRVGWNSGNAIAIVFEGEDQGASADDNARDMESFENIEDPNDGGDGKNHPERAPKLVVVYQTGSGIANRNTIEMSLFPNPVVDGKIQLQLDRNKYDDVQIEITGLNGQIVKTMTAPNSNTIDVSDLESGNYILTVRSGNDIASEQIIIE